MGAVQQRATGPWVIGALKTIRTMAHSLKKDSGMKSFPWTPSASAPTEEWLGAESHMPNLKQELRKQNHQGWDTSELVVADALASDRLTLLLPHIFPYNAASSSICMNKSSSAACTAAPIGSWSEAVTHRMREPTASFWTT